MIASSNQPGQLFGTAKTHKFENNADINLENLKFRPIISQVGTYTYNAAKVIADYLKPLVAENDYMLTNTQDFADEIRNQPPLNPDEEYVSYDVKSLFTNVPVKETIDYILNEIYEKKKLPSLCKRSMFKKLLEKLTCECTFMFNDNFYEQIDGCTMGGPLSVILSNIFMTMLELHVVKPMKPKFYRRYVDDIIKRRKKNCPDLLLEKLNSYHPNIEFTVEVNPAQFLDTQIIIDSAGLCQTRVYRKPNKFPIHWCSKSPVRYKRNAIIGDLYRAKRISSNFDVELIVIKRKFIKAGFPTKFVDSVIRRFVNPAVQEDEDLPLIPEYFYEDPKPFVLVELPYCQENERLSKYFVQKFKDFLNTNCIVVIKWVTKKVRNLFNLKSRNPHPACKVYAGKCSCGVEYIGETKRNVEVRWGEHNNPQGKSEPSKHLYNFPTHSYTWSVLMSAPKNVRTRRNLEASEVALKKPVLNNQVDSKKLTLFRYGVT